MTVHLPPGVYPITPDKTSGLWTGLNIRSGVLLRGSAKPDENGMTPNEVRASRPTLLRLQEPEGLTREDVIYFVRSDKQGNNTDFGLKDIGLDATSSHCSTNTLFIGKKTGIDKNVLLDHVLLTGGSGDYQQGKGGRMGAGYALDCLGADVSLVDVVITHSRRGAIFTADAKHPSLVNIEGLVIKNINDGIGAGKGNHPAVNRIDAPAERNLR